MARARASWCLQDVKRATATRHLQHSSSAKNLVAEGTMKCVTLGHNSDYFGMPCSRRMEASTLTL